MIQIRRGEIADLDPLWDLETRVFRADAMSRRCLRRLLRSRSAAALVAQADADGAVAGAALVLFRANSGIARLYSLSVARRYARRGIARALLAASEQAARSRRCAILRLEVRENNRRAIRLYRKAGYHQFGRREGYYRDRGNALRLQKLL